MLPVFSQLGYVKLRGAKHREGFLLPHPLKHREIKDVLVCDSGEGERELKVPHRVHLVHHWALLRHEYLRLVDHLDVALESPSLLLAELIDKASSSRILRHHSLLYQLVHLLGKEQLVHLAEFRFANRQLQLSTVSRDQASSYAFCALRCCLHN